MRTFIIALVAALTFGTIAAADLTGAPVALAATCYSGAHSSTSGYSYCSGMGAGERNRAKIQCKKATPGGSGGNVIRYGNWRYVSYQYSYAFCPSGYVRGWTSNQYQF